MLPIRYRTIADATGICEALGETGDFLKPFENFDEWLKFRNIYMENPAIEKYCDHGGRYILWLPYTVMTSPNIENEEIMNILCNNIIMIIYIYYYSILRDGVMLLMKQ